MKLRATVTFEWEENLDSWSEDGAKTEEDLLECVRKYCKRDTSYFLDMDIASWKIDKVE